MTCNQPQEGVMGKHRREDLDRRDFVMWFDSGDDCPNVGCGHGWIRSGKSAAAAQPQEDSP